jgi:hypothetical protein
MAVLAIGHRSSWKLVTSSSLRDAGDVDGAGVDVAVVGGVAPFPSRGIAARMRVRLVVSLVRRSGSGRTVGAGGKIWIFPLAECSENAILTVPRQ